MCTSLLPPSLPPSRCRKGELRTGANQRTTSLTLRRVLKKPSTWSTPSRRLQKTPSPKKVTTSTNPRSPPFLTSDWTGAHSKRRANAARSSPQGGGYKTDFLLLSFAVFCLTLSKTISKLLLCVRGCNIKLVGLCVYYALPYAMLF